MLYKRLRSWGNGDESPKSAMKMLISTKILLFDCKKNINENIDIGKNDRNHGNWL